MKRFLKRIHRGNKGFTLIELLIVIAIIGVLSAVVLPNVTGLVGEGQTEAAKAELVTIQTAVDIMMAKEGVSTITSPVGSAGEDDMSKFPSTTVAAQQVNPNYLRTQMASREYDCTAAGLVTSH